MRADQNIRTLIKKYVSKRYKDKWDVLDSNEF